MLNAAEICRFDSVGRAFEGDCRKPMENRNFRNFAASRYCAIGRALAFGAPPRYLTA